MTSLSGKGLVTLTDLPYMIQLQILAYLDLPELLNKVAPLNKYFYHLAHNSRFWQKLDFTNSQCHLSLSYLRQLLGFAPLASTLILSRQACDKAELSDDVADIVGEVLHRCPRLIYLQLAYLRPSKEALAGLCIGHRHMQSSQPVGGHLLHLDLSGSDQLTPELVETLARSFPRLQSLCLAHCRRACDSTTGHLGRLLTQLSYINLDENTTPPEALNLLLMSRTDTFERVVLDASGCESRHLAPALASCLRLRMLCCDFAEDVSDELLDSGISQLGCLESLTLRKAYRISDEAFNRLGQFGHFPSLTHLDLTECRCLTDEGLHHLVSNFGHRLEILVLNWCWKITDNTVDLLFDTCRLMSSLSLVGLHQLTGKQLPLVPERMPDLRFLDLRNCNAIQDPLCHQLVAQRPCLCIVDFFGFIVDGSCDAGGVPEPESAAGFAFTERWTRPLRLLRM
ncbi:hypothetical protein BOX15_Mlig026123g3 [Macrostomum lignano]|uniref:F-box domain-containing protein n=2 Tax=Macrostomum lignano TaxID=282301 RepID=A0A267GKF3_9PLAT|nr:hypothetical protein BOX15_Mlig026123g3 [Macrostomum lignano]